MGALICRGFQHRNRFSMRIGRKPAGHDPALMTKAVFPFVRSERQGALANAAYRVNPRQIRKALFHRLTTFPSVEGYRVPPEKPPSASKRERGGAMSKHHEIITICHMSEVSKSHAMGEARQVVLPES